MTRDSRHAALRSISLRGASGDQVRPFARRACAARPPGARRAPRGARARAARGRSGGPGAVRRARSGRCRCGGRTQFPQLRELQADVAGVHRRDDQAGHAVSGSRRGARSCAGTRRADAPPASAPRRAPPVLEHLPRGQRRVAVHRLAGDARCRDRRSAAARRRRSTTGPSAVDRFVDVAARSSARAAGRRAAAGSRDTSRWSDPAARGERSPAACGKPATAGSPARIARISSASGRRDALVGVERQDPVVAGLRGGEVLLRDVAGPRPDDHLVGVACARWPRCRRCCRQSTTMISSAQATDASAAAMLAASLRVMTVTDTLRHGGSVTGRRAGQPGQPAYRLHAAAVAGRCCCRLPVCAGWRAPVADRVRPS